MAAGRVCDRPAPSKRNCAHLLHQPLTGGVNVLVGVFNLDYNIRLLVHVPPLLYDLIKLTLDVPSLEKRPSLPRAYAVGYHVGGNVEEAHHAGLHLAPVLALLHNAAAS